MKPVNKKTFMRAEIHVFRRWSRNSYAVFVSMKKQVKISCLRLTYGKLIGLTGYVFSHFAFVNYGNRDNCEDEELDLLSLLLQKNESILHCCVKEITASGIISFRQIKLSQFLNERKIIL